MNKPSIPYYVLSGPVPEASVVVIALSNSCVATGFWIALAMLSMLRHAASFQCVSALGLDPVMTRIFGCALPLMVSDE